GSGPSVTARNFHSNQGMMRCRTRKTGAHTSSSPRNEKAMRQTFIRVWLAFSLMSVLAGPAFAANKEHQQLMADIRILQEQSQQLQNLIGSLAEALKAVNARLDDQTNANRKAFADQKLIIDALSSDLRIVREKVDDTNVRVGSVSQEVDALRQAIQQ